jgi:succinyl-diaminopimelate desuccinylase
MGLSSEFLGRVDSLSDELVELLRGMIRIPSENPPGDESEVANYIVDKMKHYGLDAEAVESKKNRVNAVGTLRGVGKNKAFLYNGHIDTVPAGKRELWSVDPYEGVVKDGRIYGRATGDMKGATACAMIAAKALNDIGVELNGDFHIHGVADEEAGATYGTRYLIEKGYASKEKVSMAVCGEGSVKDEKIHVQLGIPGNQTIKIKVKGKSAHGGRPWEGINAVVKMCKVLIALNDYKLDFTPHSLFADPTVIVGKDIKIETHGSSIPIYCESTYRIRTVPGMTNDDVIKQLNSVIYNLTKNDPEIHAEIETIKVVKPSEPLNTQESRKLLKIGGEAVKTVTGYELKPYHFAGGNDTRWLRSVGLPTIVLGPADIFRYGGHRPDEWVSIDRLIDFTKIYGLMAMEICKI